MRVFLTILFYFLTLPAMAQPLRVDRGGTGLPNIPLNNLLLGNGIAPLTLLAPGTNGYVLTIAAGAPSWQPSSAGSGTVTSVGLSLPNIFTVTNSPVTTSGTLTGTLASQNQNLIFASPNGSSGAPSFRALVSGDIPSLSYEPVIAAGTTAQYWRGDKSWQTLNATAVGLGSVTNNAQLKIASNLSDVASANTSLNNLLPSQSTHNGEFLTTNGTDASWAPVAGSGTVTTVSVVTANGLSGTVANPTTTPAITLDVTGLALTKLAPIADQRALGNVSGGSAAAIALTNTQFKTFLAIANTDVSGLGTASTHPASDFVSANVAITGATKTKITYDAKGLVTSGADATTADIAASTDKNYVTDAQAVVIGNTSGTNSGNVTLAGENYLSIASQVITANAVNLSGTNVTGTLAAGRFPALTGDITNSAGSLATTLSTLGQTALKLKGGDANAVTIKINETETGARTLNLKLNDADRTVDLSGNLTLPSDATISGTNTGDVTKSGENYLSLSGQAFTANAVDLSGTNATGILAAARFPALTGDVTTSSGAVATTIANSAVTLAKMADVATSTVFYRKTAGSGAPEVNTLATLKTDLLLTGTNSGDVTLAGENYISIASQVITANAVSLSGTNVTNTLPYNKGGTAQSSWTKGDLLYSDNNNSLAKLGIGTTNYVLTVISGLPSWQPATGMTNPMTTTGDIIYSSSGSTPARLAIGSNETFLCVHSGLPEWDAIRGTNNQISVQAYISGGIILSTPQDIHTSATPQFGNMGLNQSADGTASLALTQAISATSTDGLIIQNTTTASSGNQKWSPRLRLSGKGWKTNATAASQTVDWTIENVPVQGAANPSTNLVTSYQINGGGYVTHTTALSSGGLAIGAQALSDKTAQFVLSSGKFASQGDAQGSEFIVYKQTTNATSNVELLLNNADHVTLSNNTCWTFRVLVIGRASTNYTSFIISGSVVRDANAASTTVNGVTTTTIFDGIGVAAVASVIADVTNGGIEVVVTGKAATVINWTAKISTAEVTL